MPGSSKRLVIAGAVILLLVVVFAVASFSGDNSSDSANNTSTQTIIKPTPKEEAKPEIVMNLEEVAKHDNKEDCWFVIRGKVYDVSVSKFQDHPGGDSIYKGCGIDATTLFETRTTDSGEKVGSGTPHSSGAEEKLLPLFYIGDLVK